MPTETRPNILFLITDDQRFDTIAALGNPDIVTPNLDWLVGHGTTFTRAYAMGGTCAGVCRSSRAVVHTGRSLFAIDGDGATIADDQTTLGEHLQRHGYFCFGTGKWPNDGASFLRSFQDGANIFLGETADHWNVPVCDYPRPNVKTGGRQFPEQRPMRWNLGSGGRAIRDQVFGRVVRGVHSTELFLRSAVDFVVNFERDQPFFCYVALMAAHDPRSAPQEFVTRYAASTLRRPGNLYGSHPFDNGAPDSRDERLVPGPHTLAQVQSRTADYYAMVTHYDYWLGRLIDALKIAGIAANTLIVQTADHGLALGRHGLMGQQNCYEHSIHVPLIISGPGIAAGELRETIIQSPDVFPTLCDLVDIPAPASVQGFSALPALRDPRVVHRTHAFAGYRDVQRSVRDERYKLIEYRVGEVGRTQLFDLVDDPDETVDLSADLTYAGELLRLRAALREQQTGHGDTAVRFSE